MFKNNKNIVTPIHSSRNLKTVVTIVLNNGVRVLFVFFSVDNVEKGIEKFFSFLASQTFSNPPCHVYAFSKGSAGIVNDTII